MVKNKETKTKKTTKKAVAKTKAKPKKVEAWKQAKKEIIADFKNCKNEEQFKEVLAKVTSFGMQVRLQIITQLLGSHVDQLNKSLGN